MGSQDNWCNWLAGVVTPELIQKLQVAATLAADAGEDDLAADLGSWVDRLSLALDEDERNTRTGDRSEIWLG